MIDVDECMSDVLEDHWRQPTQNTSHKTEEYIQ